MSWEEVTAALPDAKAIVFDGCHKIYLAMDDTQVGVFHHYGYGTDTGSHLIELGSPVEMGMAIATLNEWWDASCGLRFIEGVYTDPDSKDPMDAARFKSLIAQFEYDEDSEPDEFDGDEENGIDKWADE